MVGGGNTRTTGFCFFSSQTFLQASGRGPVQQTTGTNQTHDQTSNHPQCETKLTPCGFGRVSEDVTQNRTNRMGTSRQPAKTSALNSSEVWHFRLSSDSVEKRVPADAALTTVLPQRGARATVM